MFADGHLTGLIDWELAHIGDPMLDLGVARMRNMLYPTGSLREPIQHYDEVSDGGVDWQALGFYTVMSMIFTPLGVVFSLQNPSATPGRPAAALRVGHHAAAGTVRRAG